MAIIIDAIRQAFMASHEYESLREEDKAWTKLQKPILIFFTGMICVAILTCVVISLKIVFPGDDSKRPFCGNRAQGGFSSTDQETVGYYWGLVFVPLTIFFSTSAMYLAAGITVAYSAQTSTGNGCLRVVENCTLGRRRGAGGAIQCLSILNKVYGFIFGLLALIHGLRLLAFGSSCSWPLFWCYEIASWGLVSLYVGSANILRRRAAVILDEGESGSPTVELEMVEVNSSQLTTRKMDSFF